MRCAYELQVQDSIGIWRVRVVQIEVLSQHSADQAEQLYMIMLYKVCSVNVVFTLTEQLSHSPMTYNVKILPFLLRSAAPFVAG